MALLLASEPLVRIAKANREAADHALHDRQFTKSERQERGRFLTDALRGYRHTASIAAKDSTNG